MENISREKEYERLSDILEELSETIIKLKKEIYSNNKFNYYITSYEKTNESLKLLDKLESKINQEKENLKELKNPLLLFVVGCGNYGKSTLINALIKDNIIKTTALPNTWKLDLFTKDSIEKMEITYLDNMTKNLTLEEGLRLLKEEEKKFNKSKKNISKKLNEYKSSKNASVEELKAYKNELENKYLYLSSISKTKYYLNKNGIIDDFTIVDTPGLNQVLSKSILSSIEDYYIKSDGILWIIDSQNIISKNTGELIKNIDELNKISLNKKKIILVVNKIDIIERNNKDDVNKIKEKVTEIYKDKFEDIVFISAKNAIDGFISNNFKLIEKSNINSLFMSIEKNFKESSQLDQINSKRKNLSIMSYVIEDMINKYKRQLFRNISKFNSSSFIIQDKINSNKKYIINLLLDLKNKNCYKELDVYDIKQYIEYIENIGNNELKEIYEGIDSKNFDNIYEEKFYINKLTISKNKNIVFDYKILKKISQLNSYKDPKEKKFYMKNLANKEKVEEYNVKSEIYRQIDTLINESIDDVSEIFENTLQFTKMCKENKFKEIYTDYITIKEHISGIEKINSIIKKMR